MRMTELRTSSLVQLTSRPGRTFLWLLPPWATLCGALASSSVRLDLADGARLALAILLVEGWGTAWRAMASTDWTTLLRAVADHPPEQPVFRLPYARSDAPGARIGHGLSRLIAWGREAVSNAGGQALGQVLLGLALSLAVAVPLGTPSLLLTFGAVALMQLAVVVDRGRGTIPGGWDAVLRVGLPWLAGHTAFADLTLPSLALAAAFSLTLSGTGRPLWFAGQLLAALLFIPLHRPLVVPFLVLLLVPQWALLTAAAGNRAVPWLAVAMLLAAGSL